MPKSWERCTPEEKLDNLHERLVRLEHILNDLAFFREGATAEVGNLRQQVEEIKKQLPAK
jgi:hypothetical protein